MKNAFENMDGRNKRLYEAMWQGFDFLEANIEIKHTYNAKYQKHSKNSYCFAGESNKEKLIAKIFNIKDFELFQKKYTMATNGSGEEERKITTLHSSSLCALLHFYNVTEQNPLTLEFETDKKIRRVVKFTESFFEYKSRVIHNPSNMDVVLLGKEKDQDVVLLLESKFSEYFLGASSVLHKISNQYVENEYSAVLYDDYSLEKIGLRKKPDGEGFFKLESLDTQFYIGGIKQMISHYTGVMNALDGNHYYENGNKSYVQEKVDNAIDNKNAIIILGEIVFDSIIGKLELRQNVTCGNAYGEKYNALALQIKEHVSACKRFEMITNELGYSLFKDSDHIIEPNIKKFYHYY